jgi:hypothetical protein
MSVGRGQNSAVVRQRVVEEAAGGEGGLGLMDGDRNGSRPEVGERAHCMPTARHVRFCSDALLAVPQAATRRPWQQSVLVHALAAWSLRADAHVSPCAHCPAS